MRRYFCDLHVHVGRARGRAVKITGARNLTVSNILSECLNRKGIDVVGIVDCASPPVLSELKEMTQTGILTRLPDGGLLYREKVLLIPGAEIETTEKNGAAHSVYFFHDIVSIEKFSHLISDYITNINLSSQKAKISAQRLFYFAEMLGGIMVPAHVFTPFKSFYGACGPRLKPILSEEVFNKIPAVELGLSADSLIANQLSELDTKTFLSNSDAHSLDKIAREYNAIMMEELSFKELLLALNNKKGRFVDINYGLDPKLGKYHRTRCLSCGYIAELPPPVVKCHKCGSDKIVLGVLDRITIIGDRSSDSVKPFIKPYIHQVPLEFIPGLGKKTIDKLIAHFGSEMNVLHTAGFNEISAVTGPGIAKKIILAREGRLNFTCGGGGQYGRIAVVSE